MKKNMILIIAAFGLIAGFAVTAMAQEKAKESGADEEKDKEKITTVSNKITGKISNIDKKSFSVVYDRNEKTGEEFEMLFPIGKNLRIVHKKSFSELSVGDTVEVQFEDVTIEKKDRKDGKRNTAVLTFISPGEKVVEPTRDAGSGDTIVTETTESATVAPLKSDLR